MNLKNRCYKVAVCKSKFNISNLKDLKFKTINNGWNFWVADPFPIEHDGVLYIFGEMFEYSTLKGSICYTKLTNHGFSKWKKIIDEPYHLSFPNIFKIENDYYMCPESQEGDILQLFKCIEFPDIWEKSTVLLENIKLVDTIFFNENNEHYGISCEWDSIKKHKMKFFKISDGDIEFSNVPLDTMDYYYSRPAGNVIYDKDSKMQILVSQICRPIYGSGLVFKEFKADYPHYIEKELFKLFPNDIICDENNRWDGMHTFNISENYVVIDLIWSRFDLIEKIYRLLHKIKSRFKTSKKGE